MGSSEDKDMQPAKRSSGGDDAQRAGRNMGEALRQAYDETVGEAIPDSMLDLLKKLD